MESPFNGTKQISSGIVKGEVIGFALGLILFSYSIYAFSLAIKANKLTIEKLNDEGYK